MFIQLKKTNGDMTFLDSRSIVRIDTDEDGENTEVYYEYGDDVYSVDVEDSPFAIVEKLDIANDPTHGAVTMLKDYMEKIFTPFSPTSADGKTVKLPDGAKQTDGAGGLALNTIYAQIMNNEPLTPEQINEIRDVPNVYESWVAHGSKRTDRATETIGEAKDLPMPTVPVSETPELTRPSSKQK